MALYSPKNLYRGVNAHLHSDFQTQGGWSGFHTNFITALARYLDARLPEGFIVDIEQSLQIREIHPDSGEHLRRPEPDLTIFRTQTTSSPSPSSHAIATLSQPIPATLDLSDDLYYSAVVIYEIIPNESAGTPVTRIELLSPTNKQGEGMIQYREKRFAALKSEVALVEIDFLHETPPVVKGLPRYPVEPNSYAYNITVSNPVPSFDEGKADTYAFGVDIPIPMIAIPLGKAGRLDVDGDHIYQEDYTSLSAYSRRVDYSQAPARLERYSAIDQTRIHACMERAQANADEMA